MKTDQHHRDGPDCYWISCSLGKLLTVDCLLHILDFSLVRPATAVYPAPSVTVLDEGTRHLGQLEDVPRDPMSLSNHPFANLWVLQ